VVNESSKVIVDLVSRNRRTFSFEFVNLVSFEFENTNI